MTQNRLKWKNLKVTISIGWIKLEKEEEELVSITLIKPISSESYW